MSKLTEEYDELVEKRRIILEELIPLRETEIVKRYLELDSQNKDLHNSQIYLAKAIQKENQASCTHIVVLSRVHNDWEEGRVTRYGGCIKCGLEKICDKQFNQFSGIKTKVACDLDLARAIYSRIIEVHPNIDDKTATKYFEIALDNIRNIKVNEDREVSRAKRLSLTPSFKRWSECSIDIDD